MRKLFDVKCMSCGRVKKSRLYDSAKLKEWLETGRLMDAVCLECTPSVDSISSTRQRAELCHTCNQMKPLDSFSAVTQKRLPSQRTWHCLDCSQPVCTRCHQRREVPLRGPEKNKVDPAAYVCPQCARPVCSREGCGRRWRKRDKPYTGGVWTCPRSDCARLRG